MKLLALLTFTLLVLASCSSIKPTAPDLPQTQAIPTPLPASIINIPINVNLENVLNNAATGIPATIAGEGKIGPGQYKWSATREPFKLVFGGDTLHIKDRAQFNIMGFIKNPFNGQLTKVAACDADLNIGLSTNFGFRNDYSLFKNTHLTQFDLNACNLKIAGLDLTKGINAQAKTTISRILDTLGKRIDTYNYRQLIQPVWASLNKPIKIADIGYITVSPSAIRVGQLSTSGSTLNLVAGITANPVFSLADPGKNTGLPLPDITNASGGNGFNLHIDVHLDYQPLNKLLNDAVDNKETPVGSKGHFTIQAAQIFGTGNEHLLIKVNFTGKQNGIPYHGLLYFTCLLVYQPETGNLTVKEIDFDTNTITRLKEGPAVWLLDAGIKKYLHNQLSFNISGQINNLKSKLNAALSQSVSPNIALSGNIETLDADSLLPLRDYILLRISANGNLSVRIN